MLRALAVDCVLSSDPELEAQDDPLPPPKDGRALASEVRGLPAFES